jgi:dTMP kinase
MNEEFIVEPDLVFIFDIDPQKGLERIENRKKKDKLFEREDYLVKVREIFRSFKGEKFVHIDALKSKEEIRKEIEEIVLRIIL